MYWALPEELRKALLESHHPPKSAAFLRLFRNVCRQAFGNDFEVDPTVIWRGENELDVDYVDCLIACHVNHVASALEQIRAEREENVK